MVDGNHRISAARRLDQVDILARVTELENKLEKAKAQNVRDLYAYRRHRDKDDLVMPRSAEVLEKMTCENTAVRRKKVKTPAVRNEKLLFKYL